MNMILYNMCLATYNGVRTKPRKVTTFLLDMQTFNIEDRVAASKCAVCYRLYCANGDICGGEDDVDISGFAHPADAMYLSVCRPAHTI